MSDQGKICCFCGAPIELDAIEPLEISVDNKDGSFQGLWSHVNCLGSRLHPAVPFLWRNDREELCD